MGIAGKLHKDMREYECTSCLGFGELPLLVGETNAAQSGDEVLSLEQGAVCSL